MQKWEYRTLFRTRGFTSVETGKKGLFDPQALPWMEPTSWDQSLEILEQLGDEGWELVAVVPRSSYLGGKQLGDLSLDYAGFTSEELWVFKRPREQ